MAELTIEEKAKAYDEALERAKEHYHAGCFAPAMLERIFPELKESEDERTRKELLGFIKNWKNPNNLGRLQDRPMFTKNEEQCNKYLLGSKSKVKIIITMLVSEETGDIVEVEINDEKINNNSYGKSITMPTLCNRWII